MLVKAPVLKLPDRLLLPVQPLLLPLPLQVVALVEDQRRMVLPLKLRLESSAVKETVGLESGVAASVKLALAQGVVLEPGLVK